MGRKSCSVGWNSLFLLLFFQCLVSYCGHVATSSVVMNLYSILVVRAVWALSSLMIVSSVNRSFLWVSLSCPDSSISNHNLIPQFMYSWFMLLICNSPGVWVLFTQWGNHGQFQFMNLIQSTLLLKLYMWIVSR